MVNTVSKHYVLRCKGCYNAYLVNLLVLFNPNQDDIQNGNHFHSASLSASLPLIVTGAPRYHLMVMLVKFCYNTDQCILHLQHSKLAKSWLMVVHITSMEGERMNTSCQVQLQKLCTGCLIRKSTVPGGGHFNKMDYVRLTLPNLGAFSESKKEKKKFGASGERRSRSKCS